MGEFVRIAEGRTLIGANNAHKIGSTGGSETVQLSENNMPAHRHIVDSHKHEGPYHDHSISITSTVWDNSYAGMISAATWDSKDTGNIVKSIVDNGNCSIGTSGGTDMIRYFLQNPGHTHLINCGKGGAGLTGSSSPNTSYSGGNIAHDNMQPYLAVNYWKRVS